MEIPFGPFSLDAGATRLLRNGQRVRLRAQALRALRLLLRHSGEAVSYEQMIAEAWHGTRVSRHTVDVTVCEVRRSLGEYGTWIVKDKAGHRLDTPKSDELVRRGWHFYDQRTREGFEQAIDCFERALPNGPGDIRTFGGLSASYLALAVYGIRPPRVVYPAFLQAHERAVTTARLTPELRCNRAQGLHRLEHRLAEAEAEYLQTIRDSPLLGSAYTRLATLYATSARWDEALELLGRAHLIDPLLPSLAVADVKVRYWRRDYGAALEAGAIAIRLHPSLQSGRAAYAAVLQSVGRPDDALVQWRAALTISPGPAWVRVQEATCLVHQQRHREALTILAELTALRQSEYVDACHMAVLCEALGLRERAFEELARARAENAAALDSLAVDPQMDPLRSDPRFGRLLTAVRQPQPLPTPDGRRPVVPAVARVDEDIERLDPGSALPPAC